MREVIREIIYSAITEVNATRLTNPIPKSPDLKLFGENSMLDSIDFVSLIVLIEEQIYERFHKKIQLVSNKAFSETISPFQTVVALEAYLDEKLS